MTQRPVQVLVPVVPGVTPPVGLRYAANLVERARAELAAWHVVDPLASDDPGRPMELLSERHALLSRQIGELGIAADVLVQLRRTGSTVAEHIFFVADERDSDLVVVTSKRATGPTGALLGSTARTMLRAARCPVVVIHP